MAIHEGERGGEFLDSPMVVGEPPGPSPLSDDGPAGRDGWGAARLKLVVALLAVVLGGWLAVATLTGRSGLVEARLLSENRILSDAPDRPVEPVWSEDLDDVESVALVGDRIVLVQPPAGVDTDGELTTVTARDLGTGRVLWSRRVPVAPELFIVGTDGQPHWPQPGISVADEPSDLIMGLSVVDGHTLWELPWSWTADFNFQTGRMVGVADGMCQQIDIATGDLVWSVAGRRCTWGDRNRVLVDDRGQWKLYDRDANEVGAVPITDRPPTVVDDLIVTAEGEEVAATGLDGRPRWHTDISFESPEIELLPGTGLLLVQWDDATDSLISTALDLQGNLLDDDTTLLAQASLVEVDGGQQYGVVLPVGLPSPVLFRIVDLNDPDQVVATRRSTAGRLEFIADVTAQGLLLITQPSPQRVELELAGWPDASTTVWRLELPTEPFDLETRPPTVLSSDSGLVVVTGGPVSDEKAMHVYR